MVDNVTEYSANVLRGKWFKNGIELTSIYSAMDANNAHYIYLFQCVLLWGALLEN